MAAKENAETQAAPAADAAVTPEPTKKGKLVPLLLLAGLMGGEAVGVFFLTKMFTGGEPAVAEGAEDAEGGEHEASPPPPATHGGGGGESHGKEASKDEHGGKPGGMVSKGPAEIDVTECRPNNRTSGKLITLKIRVSALVAGPDADKAKQMVEANKARINDRVNVVIRSAEPRELNEPGLETIKRRLKQELSRVLCDEKLIQEVLIPELLQSGSGL